METFEQTIDVFWHGAFVCFFGLAAYFFYQSRKIDLHRVTFMCMLVWAFFGLDGFLAYLPEEMISKEYAQYLITVLDTFTVPFTILLGYELTYTRKVTSFMVLLHNIPSILFLAVFLVSPQRIVVEVAFYFMLGYICVYTIFFLSQSRAYARRIKDVYSDEENKSIIWLHKVVFACLIMAVVWYIMVEQVDVPCTNGLYYAICLFTWLYTLVHIHRMVPVLIGYRADIDKGVAPEPVAVEPAPEEVAEEEEPVAQEPAEDIVVNVTPEVDRKYSFAPRLKEMVEEERIYLRPDLNINELARILGTNRAYLSSYLNTVLGVSFFDYINALRIDHSVELLRSSNFTVDQIADMSGFNNTYSFRRVFVKRFGVTPTDWRHENQSEPDVQGTSAKTE